MIEITSMVERILALKKIDEYRGEEHPSQEEIAITEKVLKYASECKYIQFDGMDAINVLERTTYILRWNFGF